MSTIPDIDRKYSSSSFSLPEETPSVEKTPSFLKEPTISPTKRWEIKSKTIGVDTVIASIIPTLITSLTVYFSIQGVMSASPVGIVFGIYGIILTPLLVVGSVMLIANILKDKVKLIEPESVHSITFDLTTKKFTELKKTYSDKIHSFARYGIISWEKAYAIKNLFRVSEKLESFINTFEKKFPKTYLQKIKDYQNYVGYQKYLETLQQRKDLENFWNKFQVTTLQNDLPQVDPLTLETNFLASILKNF